MTDDCLHELVSRQAERTPDARAIVFGRQAVRYDELERMSNRLARALREAGCRTDDRVCLFLPKGIEAIVSMLAVMKAGCAYVPVDLESPPQRVAHVVRSSDPALIIAHGRARKLLEALPDHVTLPNIVATDAAAFDESSITPIMDFGVLDSLDDSAISVDRSDVRCAHILFTSGSTGTPKGVMITHRNVVGFLSWACEYFDISAGERVSGHPPLHFDLSTFDIYGTLSRGAELYPLPPETSLLAPKLAAFIRESQLNQWFSVPSILTYMANFDAVEQGDFPDLKRLLWCGEVIPTPTLIYWMNRLPHVRFTNLYGPTEATIASSYYSMAGPPTDELAKIPIGQPCAGESLIVLDSERRPLGAEEVGEIYIGGVGLSPGYWRDPEKTSGAFVEVDIPVDGPRRIYRTGDLGMRLADGNFQYLGRVDSQIKSRGHRIELGEIEVAVNSLDYLAESAVVGVEVGGFEGTSICCTYVVDGECEVAPAKIRADLGALLPRYMLPAHWMEQTGLPKNANGKIDRPAIRAQFAEQIRCK